MFSVYGEHGLPGGDRLRVKLFDDEEHGAPRPAVQGHEKAATRSLLDAGPGRAPPIDVAESLRVALARQREILHGADLEIVELRSRLADAEERVEKVKQRLAYRLGIALVETRTFGAAMVLPMRLARTYRDFKASRHGPAKGVGGGAPEPAGRLATRMKQLCELAEMHGAPAAAKWIKLNVRIGQHQARMLAEIAAGLVGGDAETAASFAVEAIRADPRSRHARRIVFLLVEVGAFDAALRLKGACAAAGVIWTESERALLASKFGPAEHPSARPRAAKVRKVLLVAAPLVRPWKAGRRSMWRSALSYPGAGSRDQRPLSQP